MKETDHSEGLLRQDGMLEPIIYLYAFSMAPKGAFSPQQLSSCRGNSDCDI